MTRPAKRWQELPANERQQALRLIRGEQFMWRSGKGTNWHPGALRRVQMNYRILGAALAVLRAASPKPKGKRK